MFTRTLTCAVFTTRCRTTTGDEGGAFRIDWPIKMPGALYDPRFMGWVYSPRGMATNLPSSPSPSFMLAWCGPMRGFGACGFMRPAGNHPLADTLFLMASSSRTLCSLPGISGMPGSGSMYGSSSPKRLTSTSNQLSLFLPLLRSPGVICRPLYRSGTAVERRRGGGSGQAWG